MVGYAIYLKKKKKKKNEVEWLQKLLKRRFFSSCFDHQEQRRNEVNLFCINCHRCLCQHCLSSSSHCLHKLLQIRRYVYRDVVRIRDMQMHIDCAKVQPYTLNSSKVVHLNPRPQLKPPKSSFLAYCKVCDKGLAENNLYCSIACKVSENSDNLTNYQKSSDNSTGYQKSLQVFSFPKFDTMCVDEYQNDKSDSNDDDVDKYWLSKLVLSKPKKPLHKRKGIPHRAPFC